MEKRERRIVEKAEEMIEKRGRTEGEEERRRSGEGGRAEPGGRWERAEQWRREKREFGRDGRMKRG